MTTRNKPILGVINILFFVIPFMLFWISFALGFIVTLAAAIGWLATWLAKTSPEEAAQSLTAKIVNWSNVAAWFVPPLGIFTACYTLKIFWPNRKERKGEVFIAAGCLVLSILNGAIGATVKFGS